VQLFVGMRSAMSTFGKTVCLATIYANLVLYPVYGTLVSSVHRYEGIRQQSLVQDQIYNNPANISIFLSLLVLSFCPVLFKKITCYEILYMKQVFFGAV
jgi:hypothetical protein